MTGKVIFQVLFVAFLVHFIREELSEIRILGFKYLYDFWNLVEWSSLFLQALLVALWIKYIFDVNAFHLDVDNFCEFQATVSLARTFRYLYYVCGIAFLFAMIKINKFLKFDSRLHVLWRTLLNAAGDLFGFMIVFGIIFMAFVMWSHYIFGHFVPDFNSVGASMNALFRIMLGDLDYESLRQQQPFLAPVFIGVYGLTVVFIVLNVFIAIVGEWYHFSRQLDLERQRQEKAALTGVDYDIWRQISHFFHSRTAFRIGEVAGDAQHNLLVHHQLYLVASQTALSTATKIAITDPRFLTLLELRDTVVFASGMCLNVLRAGSREVFCEVSKPGSGFNSGEKVWIERNRMTMPGLPCFLLHLRLSTNSRFARLRSSTVAPRSVSTATFEPPPEIITTTPDLDGYFRFHMAQDHWTTEVYKTCLKKHQFTLYDVLRVMRHLDFSDKPVDQAKDIEPLVTFPQLYNALIVDRMRTEKLGFSFGRLISLCLNRRSNSVVSPAAVDRTIKVRLYRAEDDLNQLICETTVEANRTFTDHEALDTVELALAILLRFGERRRSDRRQSSDQGIRMAPLILEDEGGAQGNDQDLDEQNNNSPVAAPAEVATPRPDAEEDEVAVADSQDSALIELQDRVASLTATLTRIYSDMVEQGQSPAELQWREGSAHTLDSSRSFLFK
eukprot:c20219_g1_i5.p1 GENE.c20219_g1_i5~~c20219_g1_i5.p1  ORF type:complete len:671 (+),score=134.62 c20219_g1_i5:197-2209(+)